MRMAVIKLIVVAAALCAVVEPVQAEVRILASPGGAVGPFIALFDRVNATGERVVIDGPCLSACTLVLMMVPTERICVTRRAVLRISRRALDRPPRPAICGTGGLARGGGGLSGAGAGLDRPPRRIDVAALAVARARTRRDLSAVSMTAFVGWAKTPSRRAHHLLLMHQGWWARFALPTLRLRPSVRPHPEERA